MTKVVDIPRLHAITLGDDGSPVGDKSYIRIPLFKGKVILRIILSPGSLAAGGHPVLQTNYPVKGDFNRHTFHPVKFIKDLNLLHAYCDIELDVPGAYQYKVEYTHNKEQRVSDIGYVVAEPRIDLPNKRELLPLDGLTVLSMVPKWMGPITQWNKLIEETAYAGYNMIHFVPLQKRGSSNSPYSIADQLCFDDDVFDVKDQKKSPKEKSKIVQTALKNIHDKNGILSLSDVVWNHTSDSTEFLLKHPEAGYNLHNSPYLVPAYELDTALVDLSGNMEKVGLPVDIQSENDANAIINYIKDHTMKDLKLYEYKVIDVSKYTEEIRQALQSRSFKNLDISAYQHVSELSVKERTQLFGKDVIVNGHLGTRYHKSIDISKAVSFLLAHNHVESADAVSEDRVHGLTESFQGLLNDYNLPLYEEYDEENKVALDNIKGRLIFTRLAENGPKLGRITKSNPVIETYFTRLEDKKNQHPAGSMMLANNGWIWNADPLVDFAGPGSIAYLRRELIVWGDCVKLRYGAKPEDNPWLWQHMRDYTEQVASMFHGIRIDNCHSTPIHVAEYFLDAARKIRPDLYVLAELFTGSPEKDNAFVSRLGIHALIREAMQAWDTHELSRLAHRHGGKPVGSMDEDLVWKKVAYEGKGYDQVLYIPVTHGSMPRALFMDCTHDNETPFQKRTPQDALPNAAIVAFSDCAIGSVKGYDEIYPKLLDIVNEKSCYDPNPQHSTGIIEAKHKLNTLHQQMCLEGYTEVYVHQENDFLLVHRQHPGSQEGYLLISRTAFPGQGTGHSPIKLRRSKAQFEFAYSLKVEGSTTKESKYLEGLSSRLETLNAPRFDQHQDDKGEFVEVVLDDSFTPGSICVIKTSIGDQYEETQKLLSSIDDQAVQDLTLLDCNVILYRCEEEERDNTKDGVYNVPNFGGLAYAGLQGFMSVLKPITQSNDLGHPLCDNLRAGLWALDYTINRLKTYSADYPNLSNLIAWFEKRSPSICELPDFLVPKYFALIIKTAYDKVYAHALSKMSPLVQHGDTFIQQLAMVSVQMLGKVPSTGLCPSRSTPSLAAGLPHFTTGHMRVWGRDVNISLRGLLMVTGQYEEALQHIIAFAGSLRHGLIPNLLDSVRRPRYNSRDSVWFFMQAVQDYYKLAPNGKSILNQEIPRRFPKDDQFVEVEEGYKYTSTIAEIMQEIMERHARGIHFREYNAGQQIDEQMSDKGFNIDIDVDWESGVLVGGNVWNCGTWMDKMGESTKAGNKGHPGTPRDGAPVEITGLLKSSLRWITQLIESGEYKWTGVDGIKDKETVTFKEWNALLEKNFERVFYVPQKLEQDGEYDVISKIVNRRGVYKDVYKATEAYTEYQLRPNLFVAMAVAPEMFNKKHAQHCIRFCKDVLVGPLGMRTLDPADQQYKPYYHNSDDSGDFQTSKGRNYHQGPEWVWPLGYYLRAAQHFEALEPLEIARILRKHREYITQDVWRGLPELTNKDGEYCHDSCTTQAWSAATLLDLFHDLIEGEEQ